MASPNEPVKHPQWRSCTPCTPRTPRSPRGVPPSCFRSLLQQLESAHVCEVRALETEIQRLSAVMIRSAPHDAWSPRSPRSSLPVEAGLLVWPDDDSCPHTLPRKHPLPRWFRLVDEKMQGLEQEPECNPQSSVRATANWGNLFAEVMDSEAHSASVLHPMFARASSETCDDRLSTATALTEASRVVRQRAHAQDEKAYLSERQTLEPTQCLHRVLQSLTLHPSGAWRFCWDVWTLMLCAYDSIVIPVDYVDLWKPPSLIELCACVFWTCDIFVSLTTGYYTKEGLAVMKLSSILRRYVRRWLPLDLSLVAIDWTVFLLDQENLEAMKLVKFLVRMFRLSKVLRLIRLLPRLTKMMGRVNSEIALTFARILGVLTLMLFLNHYIACIWVSTWSSTFAEGEPPEDKTYRYTTALHWAVIHAALGSMDIAPQNSFERIFSTVVLLLAFVMFSTLLSSMNEAASHVREVQSERLTNEAQVRKYFVDHRISQRLIYSVWYYISRRDFAANCRASCSEVHLFRYLPTSLRDALNFESFAPILACHPLFSLWADVAKQHGLIMLCNRAVSQRQVFPKETLQWSASFHNIPHSMIFVSAGSLEYWPDESKEHLSELRAGNWACEEALWSRSPLLMGPLVGGSDGSDLCFLQGNEFRETVRIHKDIFWYMKAYAICFLREFNAQCNQKLDYRNLLFNSSWPVMEFLQAAAREFTAYEVLGPEIWGWLTRNVCTLKSWRSMTSKS